jgi:hypothetical protein
MSDNNNNNNNEDDFPTIVGCDFIIPKDTTLEQLLASNILFPIYMRNKDNIVVKNTIIRCKIKYAEDDIIMSDSQFK